MVCLGFSVFAVSFCFFLLEGDVKCGDGDTTEYLVLDIYGSENCVGQSILQMIYPLPYPASDFEDCQYFPFFADSESWKSVRNYTYDPTSQTLEVRKCNLEFGSNSTETFNTGRCYVGKKRLSWYREDVFVKLSVQDELPFRTNSSIGMWIEEKNYGDSNCIEEIDQQYDFLATGVDVTKSSAKTLDLDYYLFDSPLVKVYCSDDWIAREFYLFKDGGFDISDPSNTIKYWKFYPLMNDQCLSHTDDDFFNRIKFEDISFDFDFEFHLWIKSFRMRCIDNSTFLSTYSAYYSSGESYNDHSIFSFHFSPTCDEESTYKIAPQKLESCSNNKIKSRIIKDVNEFIQIQYNDESCSDDEGISHVRLTNIEEVLTGDCEFDFEYNYHDDYYTNIYSKVDFTTLDRITATLDDYYVQLEIEQHNSSHDCTTFLTQEDLEEIQRNIAYLRTSYLYSTKYKLVFRRNNVCQLEMSGLHSRSQLIRCENNKVIRQVYRSDDVCYGYFTEDQNEYLHEGGYSDGKMVCIHTFCIPTYCFDISEHNSKVCSSRGMCIGTDTCQCLDSYAGENCETWRCGTKDRNDVNVCNGQGVCEEGIGRCKCKTGWNGELCETNGIGITFSVLGGMTIPYFIGSFVLFLLCCCCFCFSCLLLTVPLVCCSCILGSCGILLVGIQIKAINRYEQLDDFDIHLQEQLMEDDGSKACLRINKELFEIEYKEIIIQELIGQGGSGAAIFRAQWKGKRVAFKCFKLSQILQTEDSYNLFESEVNLLASLHHPKLSKTLFLLQVIILTFLYSIIRFFGASLKPPRVGIIMEYCENGEIIVFFRNFRKKKNREYPKKQKLRMCREIISSLDYLHSRKIIHRDLKSENILVDSIEVSKLMDFGISRVVESAQGEKTKRIGTNIYMAPEILSGRYDQSVDVFSFGILLYVIFTENENPYGNEHNDHLELLVANNPMFRPDMKDLKENLLKKNDTSKEDENPEFLYTLIQLACVRCWDANPSLRYSFEELAELFQGKELRDKSLNDEELRKHRVRSAVFKKRGGFGKKDDDQENSGEEIKEEVVEILPSQENVVVNIAMKLKELERDYDLEEDDKDVLRKLIDHLTN